MKPEDILNFWFTTAGPSKWYNGGDAFDADIRARFEMFSIGVAASMKKVCPHEWEASVDSTLALIIALDQFPRNMYRNTKGAFSFDDLALAIACRAVDKGYDLKAGQDRRSFFYMPYMHAENLAQQDECVRLVDMRLESENTLFHAKAHRKTIVRFGRFPYRNEVLGRTSTVEEVEYLRGGGYVP